MAKGKGIFIIIQQKTINSNSYIKKVGISKTLTSDSYILKAATNTITSESYIKKIDNTKTIN